jgi:PAS domain S-box-containing protein
VLLSSPIPIILRYLTATLLAAAAVAAAAVLHLTAVPLAPLFLAVIVSAWVGGLTAGLVTAALGFAGVVYFLIPPLWHLGWVARSDAVRVAAGGLVAVTMTVLVSWARRAIDRASREAADAERLRRDMQATVVEARREAELNRRLAREAQEALASAEEASLRAEEAAAEAESAAIEREEAVTEAEEAARQQAETLALLHSVLAAAPVGLAFLDRDLRFVRINGALAALHGLTPAAYLGRTLAEVLPSWAPAIAPLLRQVLDTGQPAVDRELAGQTPAGRHYEVQAGFYPVRSALGEIAWVGITAVDITERKRVETNLRESEARFHQLADTAPALIWMTSPDTRCEYLNKPWLDFTGRPLEEQLGSGWLEGVHPDDRVHAMSVSAAAVDARRPFQIEYRLRRHDGTYRWVVDHGIPRYAPDRTYLGFIGSCIDIDDRRTMEASLRLSEERLQFALRAAQAGGWEWELATDARTWTPEMYDLYGLARDEEPTEARWLGAIHAEDRELVRATLRRTVETLDTLDLEFRVLRDGEVRWVTARGQVIRDEAGRPLRMVGISFDSTDRRRVEEQVRQAQKMEAVGRVAGGVAHEINNMMTVILGFSEFLDRNLAADSGDRGDVREIRRAAERSASITRQLLAYSRRALVQPRVLTLNAVVDEMTNVLRQLLGEVSTLRLELAADLAPVRVDRGQIEQVIINLVLNARDAMPRGGELLLATRNTAKGMVELVCRDNGSGMTPEVRARIFEPFFTTKEPGKGTGLGLATVYGIVTQSGGQVTVDSEPEVGTTVVLRLPVSGGLEREAAARPPRTSARGVETVLVAEDEVAVRRMARRSLEDEGYRVVEAADGDAALALLAGGERIDLLLTDVFMPGMGGRELAEAVATRHPQLPVLFMSGYTDDDVLRRGLIDLDAPILAKPFTPETLATRVRQVLDAEWTSRTTPPNMSGNG